MRKVVLITGGNSGIGFETANVFKKKGYKVFISGRNSEKVNKAANELGVEAIVGDMSNSEDVKAIAGVFFDQGLDVLVNNAAVAGLMPFENLHREAFLGFFDTNVYGPMLLIKELIPALNNRQGSIVNVSSIVTSKGIANATLYASTKGALEGFSRSLALELAPMKIRVNVVSPGAIDTPLLEKVGISDVERKELKEVQEAKIPLHRYGYPEEVAKVILAQAEATYVTGSIWTVDGGVDT